MNTDIELPAQLNNPFCYELHPLCQLAAEAVCSYINGKQEWADELAAGKMLGVLVCQTTDRRLGFLAAYSGQLGGREDWPWFVPAVFDYLQPDGYFKQEEAEISAINRQIALMEQQPALTECRDRLMALREKAEAETVAYKQMMALSKARRDAQRGLVDEASLIRESQYQKAELRRLKKRWQEQTAGVEEQLHTLESDISALRQERHRRSDALQRWLFDHFVVLNALGEQRTLSDIFARTPQQVPPSGAGECCAPKLFQYAFKHGLRPVSVAEFWYGRSPKMEVRHHGQFYPACRGKCKPILEWMLVPPPSSLQRGGGITITPPFGGAGGGLAGGGFLVINKPAGLLSVPGRTGEASVESILRQQYGQAYMVHRLDQDTSGLMVVALTQEAYHHLQRQFLARTIYKKYIALLDGEVHGSGTIRLPLRPDPLDRPRQVVDFEHGKEAVTDYEVLDSGSLPPAFQSVALQPGHHYTLVALTPHTGRTHQLRMHCAHHLGLGCPIVGDRLYGTPAARLCLHAAELAFEHPVTGEPLHFSVLP